MVRLLMHIWVTWPQWVNAIVADALIHGITRSSAAIVFTMQNEQLIVFHLILTPVPYVLINNENDRNILMFPHNNTAGNELTRDLVG